MDVGIRVKAFSSGPRVTPEKLSAVTSSRDTFEHPFATPRCGTQTGNMWLKCFFSAALLCLAVLSAAASGPSEDLITLQPDAGAG